jgi:hypothetical protein
MELNNTITPTAKVGLLMGMRLERNAPRVVDTQARPMQ